MTELLASVLDAYGGRERWAALESITVEKTFGGVTWPLKHVSGLLDHSWATVELQRERTTFHAFTSPARTAVFTPDLVEIRESGSQRPVESLTAPRASFAGHQLETPWSQLQLVYFAGYAMWTYLTEPYSLTLPGVSTQEIEPWREGSETWRRLAVQYPSSIATHSPSQVLYVDSDGLIRRRDYSVEIIADVPSAQYIDGHEEVDGVVIATRRRVYGRDADNHPQLEPVIVSIDLDDITLQERLPQTVAS